MKTATARLQIVLLICVAGAWAIFGFCLSQKTPAQTASAASAADSPKQTNAAATVYQSDLLDIARAPNEPVRVADTRIDKTGDLLIEVENGSSQPVTLIRYYLAHADCPKSVKPFAYLIGYGDRSASSGNGESKTEQPLAPHSRATLRVAQKTYKGILNAQKLWKCASSAKPKLILRQVTFKDRSGWEGFADGASHSEWNGRFLTAGQNKQ